MPSSYNPAADLKTGTRYRRKSDGEVLTLVARFPNIMLRSAKGPWTTTYKRLMAEFEEVPND